MISELLTELRGTVGCLYKLSECVAMLDMLVSLAHTCTVSNYGEWVSEWVDKWVGGQVGGWVSE